MLIELQTFATAVRVPNILMQLMQKTGVKAAFSAVIYARF
jgi:hypothetical protein